MILVLTYAQILQDFLKEKIDSGIIHKFKIFVRSGFLLEAYIFASDCQILQDIESEFYDYLDHIFLKKNNSPVDRKKTRVYFKVLPLSELEDSYYSSIVVNPDSIDNGPRYRFDSFIESNNGKRDKSCPPVITFYSHKGGVGRTTAMTSYALHLAKEGKTVAIIDCDLEAPGYLNFFNFSNHEELLNGEKNGLVEFLSDRQFLGENNVKIDNYMLNVGARNRSRDYQSALDNIWLIPAGNLNEGVAEQNPFNGQNRRAYLEGLAKLNLGNTQKVVEGFKAIFDQLKQLGVEAILIDSRTGFNDIFGTAALHLSSCVVGFFGLSRQNEPGLINLLEKHVENENLFKLILAYSILPENYKENQSLKLAYDRMDHFIDDIYKEKEAPARQPIRRNVDLERIGIGDKNADENFIKMNTTTERKKQFSDYVQLFEKIDSACFPMESRLQIVNGNVTKEYSPFALRNVVLQHLKKVLLETSSPAGNVAVNPKTFFYRKCMGDFFKREKFVIRGRKGTGKSYFCKSIKDPCILGRIRDVASEYTFSDVLTPKKDDYWLLLQSIKNMFEKKEEILNFWRLCTWAKLMFDENIKGLAEIRTVVKQQSSLTYEYDDNVYVAAAFIELMDVDKLLKVEEDIHRFNEELKRANKTIFFLYDQLESLIQPEYWNKTISSLINYWMGPGLEHSNIIPKIFVRTDLLSQIESLNTELTPDNIINMEWSIEEVFGYFFKLVFSDSIAGTACWNLAECFNVDSQYILDIKGVFETNDGQFNSLSQSEMEPLFRVFFGNDTKKYGKPWDYFKKELSNADYTVNLQAFINILNKNAIDKALAIAESDVTEIISPDIYTSTNVRSFAVTEVFRTLIADSFCKDLIEFQYVVLFGNDGMFRYKSLDGTKFESLINETCKRLDVSNTGDYKARLISSIFANGIMSMEHTTKGDVFNFAPLYWFSWGLQDEMSDNDTNLDGRFPREWNIDEKERYYKECEEEREEKRRSAEAAANVGVATVGAAAIAAGALGLGSGLGIPVVAAASALGIASAIAKKLMEINDKK